jgi:acetyl-CoA carboxylase carboxyltransferase component
VSHDPAELDKAPETFAERLSRLEALKHEAIHAGSAAAVEKQHAKGNYTARERIEKLLDPGSFQELDVFVRHRTTDFDMQRNRPYADAVAPVALVTGADKDFSVEPTGRLELPTPSLRVKCSTS